jgi:hypothetical protein
MTDHESVLSAQDPENVAITANTIQDSLLSIPVGNSQPLVTIHPDGRLEFGDDYQPDEAAQLFWQAVQRFAPTQMEQQFGKPLAARIDAELAAGERAQQWVEALTEAVVLWRNRPGGDVGLAIALSGILDTDKPDPPAATALVRVLKECDRIERAVKSRPTSPDFDGAYLACLRRIRQAAGVLPADEED